MAINYAVRFLIYSSVSEEILGSVLTPCATAHAIWTAVEVLFHDNKASCALALEVEFHSPHHRTRRPDGAPVLSNA
jgi:hypothetical protein